MLARAGGIVVREVGGIADNVPGRLNEQQPLDNHVVIDHGNGEHSFVAHLQRGSLSVAVGRRVSRSEPIGRCGNSGRSSEPHVHYHLQSTATPFHGLGLPAQFQYYCANGVPVDRGEPARGQSIAHRQNGCATTRN